LAIGWTLDAAGGLSPMPWGLTFGVVAILMALATVVFIAIARVNWKAIVVGRI
jgi:hypothetical protein